MKSNLSSNPDSLQETCLGIPFVGERNLTEEARATLGAESGLAGRKGCAWGCATPGIFIFAIALAVGVTEIFGDNSTVQAALTVIVLLCTIACPAYFFLRANDSFKLRSAGRSDLKTNAVKCYQGHLPGVLPSNLAPDTFDEPVHGELVHGDIQAAEASATQAGTKQSGEIGGVAFQLDRPLTLEVLAGSRRLWRVNGQPPITSVVLPEEVTARQPAQAAIAAKWAQPAVPVEGNVLDVSGAGQRDLSADEREEIRRRARMLWRRPALGALFFTLWIGLPLSLNWYLGAPTRLEPMAYFVIAMAVWTNYNLAKTLVWGHRLRRDSENGVVIVTRLPRSDGQNPNDASATDTSATDTGARVVELLPISKWVWSQAGHPAQWRLQK